jgi:succinate dehydrogenase/fumarate reductase flavoprotein subunit
MRKETVSINESNHDTTIYSLTRVHTLVIGSGAAGLNAAVQLVKNNIRDVMILTEGLSKGTSINTGSDKQTYYKLSLCGEESDSIRALAETYFAGGSMHGDLALIEASLSARAFINLVNLGVPFPRDEYGQFVGYKTDHDPRQRATSIGPYTSRDMCRRLIEEAQRLGIEIREGRDVIKLVVIQQEKDLRIVGVVALDPEGKTEAYEAENVIFAVGGPGGLYKTSVYPLVHTGAIGLALKEGACASNLTESQYGLASTKFRWNVSGTYMQVIPRVISRSGDGLDDEREFLPPYFPSIGEMNGMVFMKGYQWPFDARKVMGGSSIIDILVYIETVVKGRHVYLDFRRNPEGFLLEELPFEAREYLKRSNALQNTPIERLRAMNPGAIELYLEHDIDLAEEPLEIAVCAQHNNGGLAGNMWWESTNIKHLFPVGEVNGSHGVSRPGGASLNAGQVGGFRAAEYIAHVYPDWSLPEQETLVALQEAVHGAIAWIGASLGAQRGWEAELDEVKQRMSRVGAHIRSLDELEPEIEAARRQAHRIETSGCGYTSDLDLIETFRTRQLCFAHMVYLEAVSFALKSGVGSRGSAIVLDKKGQHIHPMLDESWRILPENRSYREKVLETFVDQNGMVHNEWVDCRPIPEIDSWFETTWARFRSGEIYRQQSE